MMEHAKILRPKFELVLNTFDKELSNITKTMSEIEKCPVELKVIVDSTLIGGIKVVINDHIYDGSIKHHIEEMKNTLLKKEGD